MQGHRIGSPSGAHHFERITVNLLAQVFGDYFPRVATIIASKNLVCREIEAFVVMRANDQGCVPIPAVGVFAFALNGLDVYAFASGFVETHQPTVLRLAIHDVWIGRIHLRLKSIATAGDVPIKVADAVRIGRARRSANGIVILRAALRVVKWLVIINRHTIKLCEV